MSDERDELAALIASAEYPNMNPPWAERKDRSPVKYYSRKYADVLIAAGYRKPRQITTVDELDALPVGSVVLDPCGLSVHKTRFEGWCASNGMRTIMRAEITDALPATVLWEPLP